MDAALTAVPGGIRVVWGAIRSTDSSDPNQDLNTAVSTDGGASWQLTPGSIIPRGAQAYGSDASATTLPDGTVLQAWAGTLGTWVHAGLDPAMPNVDYQGPLGTYGYGPGLASDSSGRAMMTWFSSSSGRRGVIAQAVNADGSPAGPAQTMPGSQVMEGAARLRRRRSSRAARAAASTSRTRSATRPRTRSACGASARAPRGCSIAPTRTRRSRSPRTRRAASGRLERRHVRRDPRSRRALDILALFGTGNSSGGATYAARVEPG